MRRRSRRTVLRGGVVYEATATGQQVLGGLPGTGAVVGADVVDLRRGRTFADEHERGLPATLSQLLRADRDRAEQQAVHEAGLTGVEEGPLGRQRAVRLLDE